MDVRTLICLAQKGHIESKELLFNVPGLTITHPRALADLIYLNLTRDTAAVLPKPADRNILKDISIKFHTKAGTLTESVLHNLGLFVSHTPTIRVAHQANTFAYLGVYAQFIFLDLVAHYLLSRHRLLSCQVYIIVDYDVAGDKRFRVNHFPDIERQNGSLALSSFVSSGSWSQVNYAVDKPSKSMIDELVLSLRTLLEHDMTVLRRRGIAERELGRTRNTFGMIEQEIWEAYNRSCNLSEFNAIFLSRMINLHWKLPTAFVPTMAAVPAMKNCYENLLQHYPSIVSLLSQIVPGLESKGISVSNNLRLRLDDFPYWLLCEKCLIRVPLKLAEGGRLLVEGACRVCGSKYKYDLGTYSAPNLGMIYDRLIPKVMFDDLADIVGWRFSGGVGYAGGAEHVLVSGLLAYSLGWHPLPECLWCPKGIHYGLAEMRSAEILAQKGNQALTMNAKKALREAFFGKASILYYILSQGFDGLLPMWKEHFENDRQVYDINVGQPGFAMSENMAMLLKDTMCQFDNIGL